MGEPWWVTDPKMVAWRAARREAIRRSRENPPTPEQVREQEEKRQRLRALERERNRPTGGWLLPD